MMVKNVFLKCWFLLNLSASEWPLVSRNACFVLICVLEIPVLTFLSSRKSPGMCECVCVCLCMPAIYQREGRWRLLSGSGARSMCSVIGLCARSSASGIEIMLRCVVFFHGNVSVSCLARWQPCHRMRMRAGTLDTECFSPNWLLTDVSHRDDPVMGQLSQMVNAAAILLGIVLWLDQCPATESQSLWRIWFFFFFSSHLCSEKWDRKGEKTRSEEQMLMKRRARLRLCGRHVNSCFKTWPKAAAVEEVSPRLLLLLLLLLLFGSRICATLQMTFNWFSLKKKKSLSCSAIFVLLVPV